MTRTTPRGIERRLPDRLMSFMMVAPLGLLRLEG
jgi:hypothetical protein